MSGQQNGTGDRPPDPILGRESPIAFWRTFAEIAGGAVPGLLLSQMYYWSKNSISIERGGWFYNSRDKWTQETGITRREQETARRKLRELGLLEEKMAGIPCKLYFRLNIAKLREEVARVQQTNDGMCTKRTCKEVRNGPPIRTDEPNNRTNPPDKDNRFVPAITETLADISSENPADNPQIPDAGASSGAVPLSTLREALTHSLGDGLTEAEDADLITLAAQWRTDKLLLALAYYRSCPQPGDSVRGFLTEAPDIVRDIKLNYDIEQSARKALQSMSHRKQARSVAVDPDAQDPFADDNVPGGEEEPDDGDPFASD